MGKVNKEPLISVIIPAYNAGKGIKKTVKSLQNQTYENIEILIVDGGPDDGTAKICNTIAETDNRVVVHTKTNGGISSARNYGIEKATGEYIAFLDAGDECSALYIDKLYQAVIRDNSDISICGYWSVFPDGRREGSYRDRKPYILTGQKGAQGKLIKNEIGFHPCGKLYKRAIISKNKFPLGKMYEDVYQFPGILDCCGKVAIIHERLVYCYQHKGFLANSRRPEDEYDAFDAGITVMKKYKNEFPDLIPYLLYMPVSVGIRLRLLCIKDRGLRNKLNYKRINRFLQWASRLRPAYSRLGWRYRLALFGLGICYMPKYLIRRFLIYTDKH